MTSLKEQSAEKYFNLANAYFEQENFDQAINSLSQAIQLYPSDCSFYILRARCYANQDSHELALTDCNKAIELQENSDTYLIRGNIYFFSKNYELALADYDKAIELDKDSNAYFNRATAHLLLGKPELALADYEEMLMEKSPDTYEDDKEIINSFIFASNLAVDTKNYDKANEFIKHAFLCASDEDQQHKNIYLKNIESAKDLEEKNKALYSEIKQKEALYKALHEKEKEMLSFFTHTMRNALATAPESLRQAIQLLGSEVYEKDTKHYQAINKIASLFSTLSLTDCLIDTFKQSISDPQEFKQSWLKDHSGEASPKWVIASALRQSLNRIIFMSDTSELRKLLGNPETALIKATRKSFIEEVLPFHVDSQGVDVFYDWTLNHISAIEVSITDFDKLNFGVNQVRFSLLFAITSELILNALKYWDGQNRIQISWQLAEQGNYVFSVKNHCKANATSNLAGTHKGLAFIKRLVELLGEQAQFVCKSEDQLFTAELILNKVLFDGES